ncbi:hypothetical protein [Tessaracoccus lapidicaptus]|uniref:hypothetical protein n=1 Tax=Tessaracoccus lapidicaptus TaxID=1427523 RepID=UPI0033424E8E
MLTPTAKTQILFRTIGPRPGGGDLTPDAEQLEEMTEYAFKSRVGLLFLEECVARGVELGPEARGLHVSLTTRRQATDAVVVRLADKLDEVASGEWVLFKSIKPFAATPNDTDWFPLDPSRHAELCDHLLRDGAFKLLEVAPRQTTLIESGGEGVTDTTKRGGIYYIDCYVFPSTDYFIYLDPRKLRKHVRTTQVNGRNVPVLSPQAELAAIMFHNVFPERTYTPESYYLIKHYLDQIEETESLEAFVEVCREQKVEYAAATNLALTLAVDREVFAIEDERLPRLMRRLGHADLAVAGFDPGGKYPYEIPNRYFWGAFLSKQRDTTSRRSTYTQLLHMLNPIFLADVVKVIWRRSVKGGVYEQN